MSVLASVNTLAATLATVLSGIGWEPEIRGALTVAVGSAVLMGSIWMILVTNSGVRLGSLIALAGFFGWMFLMGVFWWIYGIGWVGSLPSWEVKEIVADPAGMEAVGIEDAVTGPVNLLPETNCDLGEVIFPANFGQSYTGPVGDCTPRAAALLMAYPGSGEAPTRDAPLKGYERESVLQELLNPQLPENRIEQILSDGITNRDAVFNELISRSEAELRGIEEVKNATIPDDDPRFKNAGEMDDAVADLVERRNTRIDDLTLSQLSAVAPLTMEWADEQGYLPFGDWNLLSTAQSGEAVATADAALKENAVFGSADAQFVVLDTWQQGGKPKRTNDDTLSRIWHKVTSTARITHPTNYAVVQAQFAEQQEPEPGQLPPLPVVDENAATVSVVMERNLGNLRVVPALMAAVSLLLFLACCLVLHLRDLELQQRLATA